MKIKIPVVESRSYSQSDHSQSYSDSNNRTNPLASCSEGLFLFSVGIIAAVVLIDPVRACGVGLLTLVDGNRNKEEAKTIVGAGESLGSGVGWIQHEIEQKAACMEWYTNFIQKNHARTSIA